MKARTLLLALIELLRGAAVVHAGSGSAGVYAGLSAPTGNTGSAVGDGFNVGFSIAYLDSSSGIGIDANYHMLAEKTSAVQVFGQQITLTDESKIFEGAVYVRAILAPKGIRLAPYLKGGFGMARVMSDLTIRSQTTTIHTTPSNWYPVLLGGIGVSTKLGDASDLGIEVLFHRIQSGTEPDDLITVALAFWPG